MFGKKEVVTQPQREAIDFLNTMKNSKQLMIFRLSLIVFLTEQKGWRRIEIG